MRRSTHQRAARKWRRIARRVSLPGLYRLLARAVRQAAAARSEGRRAYKLSAADALRRELDRRLDGAGRRT